MAKARKDASIAGWILCAAAILALDWVLRDVELAPLLVIPLLGLSGHSNLRTIAPVALALGVLTASIEALSEGHAITLVVVSNGVFVGCGYMVAAALYLTVRKVVRRARKLSDSVEELCAMARGLFPAVSGEMFGWRVRVVDGRRERPHRDFHQLAHAGTGCELIAGDVEAEGLGETLVLAALRVALCERPVASPLERLQSLNERVVALKAERTSCRLWCGALSEDGIIRFASAGREPMIVRRNDGSLQSIGGGGQEFGQRHMLEVPEHVAILEVGEAAMLPGPGLAALFEVGLVTPEDIFSDDDGGTARLRGLDIAPDAYAVVIERSAGGVFESLTAPSRQARR